MKPYKNETISQSKRTFTVEYRKITEKPARKIAPPSSTCTTTIRFSDEDRKEYNPFGRDVSPIYRWGR